MSISAQSRKLSRRGAQFRGEIFGTDAAGAAQEAVYDATYVIERCYFTPVNYEQQPIGLMLKDTVDCTLRFAKEALPVTPALGKKIILRGAKPDGSDLTVRFEQFISAHPLSPEHVLGCHQL